MQNRSDSKIYAGFYVRFAAYVTDCIIALALSFLLRLPLWTAAMAGLDILKKGILFRFTLQDIIQYLAFASYFVLLTYFGHATPGKKLFRLEVITEDGTWSFVNILYRETIGRFISGLLNIGYIAVAVSAKKQGFHDMFCDTFVVYKDMVSTVPVPVGPPPAGQAHAPQFYNTQGVNMAPPAVNPIDQRSETDQVMTPGESRPQPVEEIMRQPDVPLGEHSGDGNDPQNT